MCPQVEEERPRKYCTFTYPKVVLFPLGHEMRRVLSVTPGQQGYGWS